MQNVYQWFTKQQKLQADFVSLYDMMFESQDISYLFFRLRYYFLQVFVQFFLHAVFFYFMSHKLTTKTFTIIIVASGLKMMLKAGWWGVLETMRAQVRSAFNCRHKRDIDLTIGFWLGLTALLSSIVLLGGCYFIYQAFGVYQQPNGNLFTPLFLAIMCFCLAIQLPIRTYHSGIFSVKRIMRPWFSMIGPHLIGIVFLFLLWPFLNIYAILVTFLFESLTSSYLTYYYTKKMYHLLEIKPRFPEKYFFQRTNFKNLNSNILHSSLAGLANSFMMGDSMLIMAFYFFALGDPSKLSLLYTVYLIAPLIHATTDWAHLFYFDRKKLSSREFARFIDQYDWYINRAASLIGLCLWILSLGACFLLLSSHEVGYCLLLLPFFLMRPKIANLQIKNFTQHYYFDVIVSGLVLVGGLFIVGLKDHTLLFKGVMMSFALWMVWQYLKKPRLPQYQTLHLGRLYENLYAWLTHLSRSEGAQEVYFLKFHPQMTSQQKIYFINQIKKNHMQNADYLCIFDHHSVAFFRTASHSSMLLRELVMLGGGFIQKIESKAMQSLELIKKELWEGDALPSTYACDKQSLIEDFFQKFPMGICYDPLRRLGPHATPLPVDKVRGFIALINKYLLQEKEKGRNDIDLSVFINQGTIQVIFVVPTKHNKGSIQAWHKHLHAINIHHA